MTFHNNGSQIWKPVLIIYVRGRKDFLGILLYLTISNINMLFSVEIETFIKNSLLFRKKRFTFANNSEYA